MIGPEMSRSTRAVIGGAITILGAYTGALIGVSETVDNDANVAAAVAAAEPCASLLPERPSSSYGLYSTCDSHEEFFPEVETALPDGGYFVLPSSHSFREAVRQSAERQETISDVASGLFVGVAVTGLFGLLATIPTTRPTRPAKQSPQSK